MARLRLLGRQFNLPGHPALRMALGGGMVAGGLLGFLPVLGFWMVPVGVAILAVDLPPVRRVQRRASVGLGAWLHRRFPAHAARFGYGPRRPTRAD